MFRRSMETELKDLAKSYPVVTIIGPRQSGKTTLCKMCFPRYTYCSLENPDIRSYAASDPRAFLNEYKKNVIFDEIQRVPELLSYIQGIVDSSSTRGQFILTGSHQLQLRSEISQSLAGRTAILTLLPLSLKEIIKNPKYQTIDKETCIFKGSFPRIIRDRLNPTKAYSNYYKTYIERDVRQLINIKDITLFEKFIKLMAGRVGQLLNLNSLASDVGASSTTLKEWLSVLEASFIVFKLSPYFENFGKRIIKSPKYYFVDTGLLCYLLGIENITQLKRDPLVGNIFENFVVMEAMKERLNKGEESNIYFFRDSNNNEVDIVFKKEDQLIPIEIKSSHTYNLEFEKGINYFQKNIPKAGKGIIIYSGDLAVKKENLESINFKNTFSIF